MLKKRIANIKFWFEIGGFYYNFFIDGFFISDFSARFWSPIIDYKNLLVCENWPSSFRARSQNIGLVQDKDF
jgi:hypothetical protein